MAGQASLAIPLVIHKVESCSVVGTQSVAEKSKVG